MNEVDSSVALPRQLVDGLPEEVLRAGAPPTLVLPEPYSARLADPEGPDAELITEWMNRPHLAEAWEYDWPVDKWRQHLRAQLDTDYSRPVIVSYHGSDSAYLEIYRAAQDSIARCYDARPHDLGIHAAIGDPAQTGRGLGPVGLAQIVVQLFAAEPECTRVMYDPDHRNSAARRLLEAAGTVYLGEHDMSNRRMALYATVRAAEDTPVATTR